MGSYLTLVRPLNCAMSGVAVFLGGFICIGMDIFKEEFAIRMILAVAAAILFVAAGNSLNDYEDRFIDKKAHPERPIPSRKIVPKTAKNISYALFILSALISVFIGTIGLSKIMITAEHYPFFLLLINMAIMLAYEMKMKNEGIAGNSLISWLTASLFLFGALSAGRINTIIIYFTAMAFFAILMREITKDIEDMKGDKGLRHTAPIVHGVGPSSLLAITALFAAIFISPLPWTFGILSRYYLAVVLAADAIFIYSMILLYRRKPRSSQNYAKLGMLISLVAFALGVVT